MHRQTRTQRHHAQTPTVAEGLEHRAFLPLELRPAVLVQALQQRDVAGAEGLGVYRRIVGD
jgi:hypothetical protein